MNAMLSRRRFLKATGLAAASLAWNPRCASAAVADKPNVVLILVDDMGWVDTACYGSRYFETPNIDRLATQGMKFSQGYAACAVCSPTRASIMTGRYPARLGVTDWIRGRHQYGKPYPDKNPSGYEGGPDREVLCPENALWLELDEITLAEQLKPAGYATCHVGKWHLGPDSHYPDKQGFDQNVGGCDFGQPPSYFDPYESKNMGRIPTLASRREGEYLTDREADEAVHFIKEHADGPFFLYMAHYAVHRPLGAKPDVIAKFRAKSRPNQENPVYAAMIQSVDDAVGRLMAALDEAGVAENTLVIFTSDNGGFLGSTDNAPLRSGKGFPYEGGIREPLLVRWPKVIQAGSTCDVPVCSIDFFPTVCAVTGVPLPEDRAIDGQDLTPLLSQSGTFTRDALFWHFPHYRTNGNEPLVPPYSIVRSGDWKLIKWYAGKPFELYNLKDDLSETQDLSVQMPDKVAELDAKLAVCLAEAGAKLPKPNPEYVSPPKQ